MPSLKLDRSRRTQLVVLLNAPKGENAFVCARKLALHTPITHTVDYCQVQQNCERVSFEALYADALKRRRYRFSRYTVNSARNGLPTR